MIPIYNEDGTYGATNDGNPIAWLDSGQTVDKYNQNFTGSLAVDYQIIDGLKATVSGSYVNDDQHFKAFVMKLIQTRHRPVVRTAWKNVSPTGHVTISMLC